MEAYIESVFDPDGIFGGFTKVCAVGSEKVDAQYLLPEYFWF